MPEELSRPARPQPATGPRRPRLVPLSLLAVFLLSLPAVNVRLYASDEVQYFAFLRSLWFDHDVSFDNEYRHMYDHGVARLDGFRETHLERTTETGLRVTFATMGPAVLWAPFYAVADGAVLAGRALGANLARDGYSWPYLAAVCYGSALYGFAAILLSARLARRLTGTGVLPAVVIWIGTPLLFYMYLAAGMAHAVSAFAVALMFTAWLAARERWSLAGIVALGATAGLVTMVREQDVVLLAGPLVDYAWSARRRILARGLDVRQEAGIPLAGLAAAGIVYLPQVLAYIALNGRPGPSPLVTRKLTWTSPHALEVLLSPAHGFLWWTPVAVLAVAGLILLARARDAGAPPGAGLATRATALALLVSSAAQVYISGCVESWTVAGAFGQRRFVALTPVLVVGFAALWQRVPAGWTRAALGGVTALLIWWNLGLMALFGTRMMDRQRLELGRNAYDVFVTVPLAAPQLAYRYVFARDSFFETRTPR